MAPMKRQRSMLDDGDTEIIDVESAQSSFQQASRKKSRVSYDEPQGTDSEDDSDEELFQEQATQYVTQQRSRKKMDNEPADNGIIETVTCTNFMCHGFLEITLGPLINFIIGHNGSGKSAILTAITICLGGKATATNRGQSLKSFIKEGEESSMLSVKIKNTAESSYQQEVYGDSIIVERHFSRSGSSSFKLKSSTGRLISTRKGDLEEICDYFALQIDNPMNVLTQDMARQFLNNSTPSDKYKFFMKGTQLEHLDGDYLIVEQNVDTIEQDLYRKSEDVKVFQERAEKAKALLALSEQQDTLRERISNLSDMMAWAQVEEQERLLLGFDKRLRRADENIRTLEITSTNLSESFSQTEHSFEHANKSAEDMRAVLAPLQEEKDRVKAEHDRFKAEGLTLHAEQREIAGEINVAKDRIKKAEKDIEDEYKRLSDADGGGHALRRQEIEEKRTEAVEAKRRLRGHENEFPALEDNRRRAHTEYEESQEPVQRKRRDVQECEQRLSTMLKDRGQQQGGYQPNMPRLLNAIRQDDRFLQKPVGPLGSHVRLLKPVWSSILEKSLGGALDSFIVTSKQDQSRLSDLMKRVSCPCQIFIGNNSQIDTREHEPDQKFDTSLRVLEIDDALAKKQLIINQGIDQTILIKDRKEAIDKMNSTKLPNVKQCFTLNVEPGTGVRLGYGYGGGLSESFIQAFRGTPRMKTDIEYQINAQRELLQKLKTELNRLEQRQRDLRSHSTRCEQAIVRHRRDTGDLQIEMQQAESIVDELQDALDQDAIEEGRLDVLKDHLQEAKDEQNTHENSYGESINAKDKNNESLRNTRNQMAEMDLEIKEKEAMVIKAESKATNCANKRAAALREMNAAFESIESVKKDRAELETERKEKFDQVEDFIRQASDICSRVPVDEGETGESLERKMEKLGNDLRRAEQRLGASAAQIGADASKTFQAYVQARDEVESIEQLAQLLKTTLVNRRNRWRMFQKHITSRARIQFFYLLSERGFRGGLMANHKEKKLDLKVEPDETLKENKGRKTMTLSGGEKSFSTVCLLLSLWDAMGAPIRCLDEFDVFMDSVNRDVSMDMMIKAARRSIGKQFILITPQSMGNVDQQGDVKIIKMHDPERGQKQLNFPKA